MNSHPRSLVRTTLALALFALACAAPGFSQDGSYGYLRVVEGSATVMQSGGDRDAAEVNQPVLPGDKLWVARGSRVEVMLADRNILRLDGDTQITLEQLAGSPDDNAPATVLRLEQGNAQLIVTEDSISDELPRIDTPNATIYPQAYGTYRITADGEDWSQVVVRRGTAQIVTERGSEDVRADEEAVVEGDREASIDVEDAEGADGLERWGRDLDDQVRLASSRGYLDDNLRYEEASLARYGSWVTIENRPYWRPRVDIGWRPYWRGRWGYTPAGLNWISSEPWGWATYHYGSWDYNPNYGWIWQPGHQWAPAWVYWYWGPSYVGWCPTGYYTHFYGNRYGGGFRRGVYGWAGGDWGGFNHWTFLSTNHLGRRDQYRYAVPADEFRQHNRLPQVPRGIITTDTRPLTPADQPSLGAWTTVTR